MTKDQILALTIADLKLPLQSSNWAVQTVGAVSSRKIRTALHSVVTVAGVLSTLPPFVHDMDSKWGGRYRSLVVDRFYTKLAKLGLTRFDCLYLPQSTLTHKVKCSLTKEEWLDKPAFLLGTLSTVALRYLAPRYTRAGEVTVRDFMSSSHESEENGYRHAGYEFREVLDGCAASLTKTRCLLRKIGFRYEDAPFMQIGTVRRNVEELAKRQGISERSAALIIRIARKEGWVRIVE